MQEIDPLWLLYPTIVVTVSFGLVVLWHRRHKFAWAVLIYAFVAYAGAIAAKDVLQLLTYDPLKAAVSGNPFPLGIYFGIQTVVFEVGGAYFVASYAVRRKRLGEGDAVAYGMGLSLWENGVLLGILPLINLVSYYAILSSGSSSLGQLVYNALLSSQPSLFDPPLEALRLAGLAVLERISSMLLHISWGWLTLLAAFYGRPRYLAVALPMGLIDALVPFANDIGIVAFEAIIFVISAIALGAAILIASRVRSNAMGRPQAGIT